jgi:hypothetical protein
MGFMRLRREIPRFSSIPDKFSLLTLGTPKSHRSYSAKFHQRLASNL